MSTRRFYCEQPIGDASNYLLAGSEHQHLAKVLRAQPGDTVVLFDGLGGEYVAKIDAVNRNETDLTIESKNDVSRELPFSLTLAVALPKGDRQQWLVEKCVELGVAEITPLVTEFGVAQPGEKAKQRIQRWIVAASKQSGRNRLMQVNEPVAFADFLVSDSESHVYVAHPNESNLNFANLTSPLRAVTLAIGPEGGFSDKEVGLARKQDCKLTSMGPRILRIETAAVAFISALIYAS